MPITQRNPKGIKVFCFFFSKKKKDSSFSEEKEAIRLLPI
jgi:hypothetical protein